MWDVRTKTSVKSFYGSYIGGQAIDIKGHELLLGNNRNENQLRIYDFKAEKNEKLGLGTLLEGISKFDNRNKLMLFWVNIF